LIAAAEGEKSSFDNIDTGLSSLEFLHRTFGGRVAFRGS
jgi:hypothetical protein